MTVVQEVHVGDIGTVFEVTVKDNTVVIDLSSATVTEFVFWKPSNVSIVKTAVFVNDGTDGKLKYTTVENDLDEHGYWKLQVLVTMPTGFWHSDVVSFMVYRNIELPPEPVP